MKVYEFAGRCTVVAFLWSMFAWFIGVGFTHKPHFWEEYHVAVWIPLCVAGSITLLWAVVISINTGFGSGTKKTNEDKGESE